MTQHKLTVVFTVLFASSTLQADPHLLAHRGLCQHAPENTLPAYAAAIDLGLDLETDVYQTKDNQLVLIHDPTLDRSTNGTGKVVDRTLAELRALDAGSWFSPAYKGLRIPTLDELLSLVKANQWRKTTIAINMKTISPGIEARIIEHLTRHGLLDACFIFAAPADSDRRFKQTAPTLAVAASAKNEVEFAAAVANAEYDAIWYYAKPTRQQIEAAHKAGKQVWLSGSCIKNDPDCWQNARVVEADGLCVNHPLDVRALWRQMSRPNAAPQAAATPTTILTVPHDGPDARPDVKTPVLLAHRGLSRFAPENTLPALAAAVSLGLGIEIDVYQTTDKELVILHDETVNRTTNGQGKVTAMSLREVQALDAGSWFDPAFAGAGIPTLDQVFRIVRARQWRPTMIGINMKTLSPGIEERIVHLAEKHDLLKDVFAFAVTAASAERFKAANPKFPLAVHNLAAKDWSALIAAPGYASVWTSHPMTAERIEAAHRAGRSVHLFEPCITNNPAAWKNAIEIGADSMCTDYPLEARVLWYGRNAK